MFFFLKYQKEKCSRTGYVYIIAMEPVYKKEFTKKKKRNQKERKKAMLKIVFVFVTVIYVLLSLYR